MIQHFPIETVVRFMWRERDGALHIGAGVTHTISRDGVSIRAGQIPSLGADVQVIVDMPPRRGNAQPGRLLGKGVAATVDHADGQPAGFAAEVCFQRGWANPLVPSAPPIKRGRPARQTRPRAVAHFEPRDFAGDAPLARELEAISHLYPLGGLPITSVSEAEHMSR